MHLNGKDHRALTTWAADCAERVQSLANGDKRARAAISAARAWARGTMPMENARKAAFAAHEAAREASTEAARQAIRAAAHAAETAHVPSDGPHAANAALKAVIAAGGDDAAEEKWQDDNLPKFD